MTQKIWQLRQNLDASVQNKCLNSCIASVSKTQILKFAFPLIILQNFEMGNLVLVLSVPAYASRHLHQQHLKGSLVQALLYLSWVGGEDFLPFN